MKILPIIISFSGKKVNGDGRERQGRLRRGENRGCKGEKKEI
jgi:hypothetical protein